MSSLSLRPPISRQTLSSPSPIRSKIPAPRLRPGMRITRRFRRRHWSCTRLRSATSSWRPISDWKSVELANTTGAIKQQMVHPVPASTYLVSGSSASSTAIHRQRQQSDFHADREIEEDFMSLRNRLKQFATHPVTRRSAWMAGAGLFIALCSPTPAHAQMDLSRPHSLCRATEQHDAVQPRRASLGYRRADIRDELVHSELRLSPESIAAVSTDGNRAANASQLRRVNRSDSAQQLPELAQTRHLRRRCCRAIPMQPLPYRLTTRRPTVPHRRPTSRRRSRRSLT